MEYPRKSIDNTFDELVNLPRKSGLYYFYDKNGKLLYVGRAKSLKSRIIDHRKLNNLEREGKFYSRLLKRKFSLENQIKLDEKIAYFRYRCMTSLNSIVIDRIFHEVTKIEIQEMPYEEAKKLELKMIDELKPLLNCETNSDEYDELNK